MDPQFLAVYDDCCGPFNKSLLTNAQSRPDEQAVARGRLSCLDTYFIWDSLLLWTASALTSLARTGRELFVRQPLGGRRKSDEQSSYKNDEARVSRKRV